MTPASGALGERWMMGSAGVSWGSTATVTAGAELCSFDTWVTASFNFSVHFHYVFCSRNYSFFLLKTAFTQSCIRFFHLSVVLSWIYWKWKCSVLLQKYRRSSSNRLFSNYICKFFFCLLCVLLMLMLGWNFSRTWSQLIWNHENVIIIFYLISVSFQISTGVFCIKNYGFTNSSLGKGSTWGTGTDFEPQVLLPPIALVTNQDIHWRKNAEPWKLLRF